MGSLHRNENGVREQIGIRDQDGFIGLLEPPCGHADGFDGGGRLKWKVLRGAVQHPNPGDIDFIAGLGARLGADATLDFDDIFDFQPVLFKCLGGDDALRNAGAMMEFAGTT